MSLYINVNDDCLKNFSKEFYVPGEFFELPNIKVDQKKKDELSQGAKGVLSNLGIQQFCRKDFFITQSSQTKFQRQQNVVPSKLESS